MMHARRRVDSWSLWRTSRRRFLELTALAGAGSVLAACSTPSPQSAAPTSAAAPPTSAPAAKPTAPPTTAAITVPAKPAAPVAATQAPTTFAAPKPTTAPLKSIRGEEIVVVDYGGKSLEVQQAELFPKFEAETGAKVIGSGGMDPTKMEQMVKQNAVEWDVVLLGPEESPLTAEWLEKLDYDVIKPQGIPKEGIHDYGVASDFYSVVLVWRTDKFSKDNHPNTWADVWNVEKFPGRRTLPRRSYDIVELALMGDGVDPARMYPIDVERALQAIQKIEPNVAKFWTGGNEPMQLLLAGEVDMAAVWVTRVQDPIAQGAPVDFTWNQHLMAQDIMAIPKGSKHVAAAMQYIGFRIRPESEALLSNLLPVGPSTRDAEPLVQPEKRRFMPSSQENLPLGHFRDPDYWIQHHSEIDARVRQLLGA